MIDGLGKGKGLYWTMEGNDEAIRRILNPLIRDQVSFLFHLNESQVKAVPEQIKDKVLDWACTLEAAGITGSGMSFSEKDKERAHSITFNIYDSHIEQLNNLGTNRKAIR